MHSYQWRIQGGFLGFHRTPPENNKSKGEVNVFRVSVIFVWFNFRDFLRMIEENAKTEIAKQAYIYAVHLCYNYLFYLNKFSLANGNFICETKNTMHERLGDTSHFVSAMAAKFCVPLYVT